MELVSFGRWVQRRRQVLKLTQAELGSLARCSTAAVRKIEAEERRPSSEVAAGFARALCIAPDEHAQFLRFARGLSSQPPTAGTDVYVALDSRVEGGIRLPATTLIGRTREQDDLIALLSAPHTRLVTLTGPGGTGKTRLALAVASHLQPAFPDGVIGVSLAPLQEAAQMLPTVAGALHISAPNRDRLLERLAVVFGRKGVLLVLDNFEHVLAAAQDVADLLERAPALRILVTSRERLRIMGEHVFLVPPLPVPDEDGETTADALARNDAVALFLERARAARRDVGWTDDVAPSVAAICRRLDGLPLAIELAAAYMALLSPDVLAAGMARRLALLTDGPRDAPARQQTLRATIDWSYQLLSPDEQRWFARLTVLVSPWPLEAATEVCGFDDAERAQVLPILRALVEKSLIRPAGTFGTQPYFAMLDTIREYGLERVEARGEREALAARHADYYTALATRAERGFHGPDQPAWYHRSVADVPNVMAALHMLVARQNVAEALTVIGGFGFLWPRTQYDSAFYTLLQHILVLVGDDQSCAYLGRALSWASYATAVANTHTALRHALDGVALLRSRGDDWGTAFALNQLVFAYSPFDDQYRIEQLAACRESVRLFEQIGFQPGLSRAMLTLANLQIGVVPEADVRVMFEQCARLARASGVVKDLASVHFSLGWIDMHHGRYAAAVSHLRYSLAQAERLQSLRQLGDTSVYVAEALAYLGQVDEAENHLDRAAALLRPLELAPWYLGNIVHVRALVARKRGELVRGIHLYMKEMEMVRNPEYDAKAYQTIQAGALEGIGCAAVDLGMLEEGARILSVAAVHEPEHVRTLSTDTADIAEHVAIVRAQFGRPEIRAAWEDGARMSLNEAIRYVFTLWPRQVPAEPESTTLSTTLSK